jgi:hypothetical protein
MGTIINFAPNLVYSNNILTCYSQSVRSEQGWQVERIMPVLVTFSPK